MARKYDFEAPVMVGNVYTSSDPRAGVASDRLGKDFKVSKLYTDVRGVQVAQCHYLADGRLTLVLVDRLRPTRSGYRLVRRGDAA